MTKICAFSCAFLLTSCSTTSESLQLGGLSGALAGVAAGLVLSPSSEKRPGRALLGGEIGSILGAGMAFFIDRVVKNERRLSEREEPEVYFGDLPPNPFIFQKMKSKSGGR